MKKLFLKITLMMALMVGATQFASAQIRIGVSVRPPAPVIVRPVAPSRTHVWVDEEWAWRDGKYVYSGGYWAAPPRPGAVWVRGHWNRHRRYGWQWIPGRWHR